MLSFLAWGLEKINLVIHCPYRKPPGGAFRAVPVLPSLISPNPTYLTFALQ